VKVLRLEVNHDAWLFGSRQIPFGLRYRSPRHALRQAQGERFRFWFCL
jgi:hypothetical protein